LRAAFLPANYEYRQRSRFLACKQGERELHEYIQEMRVLAASLVGNEHIKVTVFMDGLKVGPSLTQLFRVHANTMEEAIQIALQEDDSHRQCKELQQLELAPGRYPWNWTFAQNGDKFTGTLRESEGRDQFSVRLADGTVVNVPGVRMDLAVKFEVLDSTESFLVLDMDKYDLILGMPWLEKHEPWIDWRGKAIGASWSAVSDRDLVSNVPTSVRDWGARDGRQGAYAPEEVLGVTDPNEDVAMSLATGHETKAHCQARGIATAASHNAESRRAVRASTVTVRDGTDQAGNIGPQAAEAAEESAVGVSCVGNIVPRMVEETKKTESATCVSSVRNIAPRGVKKTKQYHVFDGVYGRQEKVGAVHLEALHEVSALLNLEELFMKDFMAELKTREIAEMVLLKPDTSPEDLNSSSVMDEDILKNPEDPVYPLVKEYSDVVSNHPPSQLPPDRGVRHEIDLVSGTKYCVTRQWPLPHELCEAIDPFFAMKAKSGMMNDTTVPAQTLIPHKDVLLNNISGYTLYNALDLAVGYYQILMLGEPLRTFAQTYFDDIFVHTRAEGGQTAMEVHLKHLRRVFEVMRANKLYANIDKCVFAAEEINVLGCFVSKVGVRADPGKVKAIAAWPTPRSQKDLRKWLGLANYLHKYSAGYAELARPLSDLLKKDADWVWERQHQDAFDSIKASLLQAPVLALPDENKSFSTITDQDGASYSVSDRDPHFTGAFSDTLFQLLGTQLTMSTADHPQTDGQTERVNRVLKDTLRSICAEPPRSWSDQLLMVAFALNNAVHASTRFTPFY
ncbi:Pol protein, partial [Phytophthora palmivora]